MWISRIGRPGALYGASISAKTFEVARHVILNPIDFEGPIYVCIEKADGY